MVASSQNSQAQWETLQSQNWLPPYGTRTQQLLALLSSPRAVDIHLRRQLRSLKEIRLPFMLFSITWEPLLFKLLCHCFHGQRLARKYFQQKFSRADKLHSILSGVIKLYFWKLGGSKYFVVWFRNTFYRSEAGPEAVSLLHHCSPLAYCQNPPQIASYKEWRQVFGNCNNSITLTHS